MHAIPHRAGVVWCYATVREMLSELGIASAGLDEAIARLSERRRADEKGRKVVLVSEMINARVVGLEAARIPKQRRERPWER